MTLEEACKKFILARGAVLSFDSYVSGGRQGQHPIDLLIEAESDIMEIVAGTRNPRDAVRALGGTILDVKKPKVVTPRKRLVVDTPPAVSPPRAKLVGFFSK